MYFFVFCAARATEREWLRCSRSVGITLDANDFLATAHRTHKTELSAHILAVHHASRQEYQQEFSADGAHER